MEIYKAQCIILIFLIVLIGNLSDNCVLIAIWNAIIVTKKIKGNKQEKIIKISDNFQRPSSKSTEKWIWGKVSKDYKMLIVFQKINSEEQQKQLLTS